MKKIFRTLAIVAVAALGLTACENDINEQINGNEGEKVTVEVVGTVADLTRSTFGEINTTDGKVPSTWSGNETVGFSAAEATPVTATNTTAGATASFSVEFDAIEEGNTVYAVSPYTSDRTEGGFTGINTEYQDFYVTIPAEQTPLAGSVQESAHLMFAEGTYEGGAMTMTFNHVAAYGKMNITNFAGNGIASVAITFPENVVGQAYYYYAGEKVGTWDSFDSATITLNPENVENNEFWFALAPVGALSGTLNVVVTDNDDKTYTKSIALPTKDSRTITFAQGQVSNFTVNMTGVTADEVVVYNGLTADEISAGLDKAGLGGYGQVTFDSSCGDWVGYVYGANSDKVLQMNSSKEAFYLESPVFDQYVESVEITFTGNTTVDRSIYAVAVDANREYSIENAYGSVTTAEKKEQTLTLTFNASTKQFALLAQGGAVYISNIAVNLTDVAIIPTLSTPVVGATAKGNAITLTWGAVANAASYNVTYGDTTTNTTDTTMTIEGLEYNTEYTFNVVAVSADANQYKNSAAATISATTEVDMGNLAEGYFYKVTSAPVDFSGTYLIVYEAGKVAFDGSLDAIDAAGNSVAVTIENNAIEATAELGESIFTIAKVDGGYTIQSASGYYLGRTNTGNGMDESKTIAHKNTIEISNGVAVIKTVSYAPSLQYYNSGANSRFRYYATSQQAIQLYKLNGELPAPKIALDKPVVTATATGTTINVSWETVEGAKDYTVTFNGGEPSTQTATTAQFTDLAYNTPYTVSVVANPLNEETHKASEAGEAVAKTEADPNAEPTPTTQSVTYTVTSTSAVSVSGSAPAGATATYKSTYNTKFQLTSGKSMTLTLSGFDGTKITGLTLSMKSNTSKGAGSLSVKVGETQVAAIADSNFNTAAWNGAWSTSYVDVTPDVTATMVGEGEDIVITISASVNSLYCQSFTIDYLQ